MLFSGRFFFGPRSIQSIDTNVCVPAASLMGPPACVLREANIPYARYNPSLSVIFFFVSPVVEPCLVTKAFSE